MLYIVKAILKHIEALRSSHEDHIDILSRILGADGNRDGAVNIFDLVKIKRIILGLIRRRLANCQEKTVCPILHRIRNSERHSCRNT